MENHWLTFMSYSHSYLSTHSLVCSSFKPSFFLFFSSFLPPYKWAGVGPRPCAIPSPRLRLTSITLLRLSSIARGRVLQFRRRSLGLIDQWCVPNRRLPSRRPTMTVIWCARLPSTSKDRSAVLNSPIDSIRHWSLFRTEQRRRSFKVLALRPRNHLLS